MRRERAKPKDALIEIEVNGTEYYGLSNSIKTANRLFSFPRDYVNTSSPIILKHDCGIILLRLFMPKFSSKRIRLKSV